MVAANGWQLSYACVAKRAAVVVLKGTRGQVMTQQAIANKCLCSMSAAWDPITSFCFLPLAAFVSAAHLDSLQVHVSDVSISVQL